MQRHRERATCLNYHIKQCYAPCQNYISQEAYRESVQKAVEFLSGKYDPILKELQEKMECASEAMEFEKAMEYRDLLASVKQIAQKQRLRTVMGRIKIFSRWQRRIGMQWCKCFSSGEED